MKGKGNTNIQELLESSATESDGEQQQDVQLIAKEQKKAKKTVDKKKKIKKEKKVMQKFVKEKKPKKEKVV